MGDRYESFHELKQNEESEKDYRVCVCDVGSSVCIVAPHGGKIEPKTSEIAKRIATDTYNCYRFEGVKENSNGSLHLTSHRFDEPAGLELVARAKIVVAIHACAGTGGTVYLGGLDRESKEVIAEELKLRGITAAKAQGRFEGSNPENICNRGSRRMGVQIEIPRDLRDDEEKIRMISEAVEAALGRLLLSMPGFLP